MCVCKLPDELPTVAAEGRLAQERRHELVPVDLVHAPAHRTAASREPRALLEHAPLVPRPPRVPAAPARAPRPAAAPTHAPAPAHAPARAAPPAALRTAWSRVQHR